MRKTLEIIYTSDVHGHVYPVHYPTGKPEDSGLLNMAAQVKKTGNTLVLDGGDSLQGTPLIAYYLEHSREYPCHPVAEGFRALGCDYYTLGNHDFNFGYEVLKEYMAAMEGSCICANLLDIRGELEVFPTAVHVLEDGLRVGITGVVTDFVNIWEQPQNLAGLRVTDPFEAAKSAYEQLKKVSDIWICIYHGGFEADLKTGELLSDSRENIACRLARETDFHLLLTGHQHMPVEGITLYGTYAVQPPADAGSFIRINLEYGTGGEGTKQSGDKDNIAVRITSSIEKVGSRHEAEPYNRLLPMEQDAQRWLDLPVGRLLDPILPEQKLEAALYGSRLANLFNQVQSDATGADFSCTSLGNSCIGLAAEVSMREISGAYQFANTLVVLEVDQKVIRTCLERCAAYLTLKNGQPRISDEFLKPKIEHYNYDFYAGICYEFDLNRPVGQRVTRLTLPDGSPLADRKYRLVTSNYRATGTGGYDALRRCPVLWRGVAEVPDLVAAYIRQHSPLSVITESGIMVRW